MKNIKELTDGKIQIAVAGCNNIRAGLRVGRRWGAASLALCCLAMAGCAAIPVPKGTATTETSKPSGASGTSAASPGKNRPGFEIVF